MCQVTDYLTSPPCGPCSLTFSSKNTQPLSTLLCLSSLPLLRGHTQDPSPSCHRPNSVPCADVEEGYGPQLTPQSCPVPTALAVSSS